MARRNRKFFFDNVRGKLLKNTNKGVKDSADEGLKVSGFANTAVIHSTDSFSDVNTKFMTAAAIDDRIGTRTSDLVDSAPSTLNTLNELAAALGDDASFSTTTATSLGNRLRIDVDDQSLTSAQKTNAVTNLGLATVASSGAYSDLTGTPTIPTNNNELTNGASYITGYTVTESDVTGHQAALSITESQISDLGSYSTFSGAYADLTGKPTLFSGAYADLTGKPTIPTNNNQLTNGAGYITSADGGNADNLDGYTWDTSGKNVRASESYSDGWFRNYNSGKGLYNQATTQHFYSDNDDGWTIAGGTGANWLKLCAEYEGSVQGWFYADNDYQGFLNHAGQWQLRIRADDGYSPSLYFLEESNESWSGNPGSNQGKIEYHSNRFYIASGSNSTEVLRLRRSGDDVAAFANDGSLRCQGNITAYSDPSDIKLKENITNIPNSLDKVKSLNGVQFTYKKDGGKSSGVIAQEVEAVLPELVYESKDLDTDEAFKVVRYGNMVGLLIEAIKEQQEQIEELKEMIGGSSE